MENPENINLNEISDEELLSLRFCDLPVAIEGTWLKECMEALYSELAYKNINFRPSCYLADEWLCPDGEPIIGIAFFLAHPRLKKLENKMMLEAEGGDKKSCIRLLRHETGHAINYAYFFHRRKKWKKLFGPFSKEYNDIYKYRPYSKNFVRHLEEWYAQYHPDEDFAETFAVWLDPGSNWRQKYKGWGALKKLEYVDELMEETKNKLPKKAKGDKYWDVRRMKMTLGTYYKRKCKLYADTYKDFHDFHLCNIFREQPECEQGIKAYKFIISHRKDILHYVALWTGEKKYIINRLLKDMIERSRELKLRINEKDQDVLFKIGVYVTSQIMNYIYTGRYKSRDEKIKHTSFV
ncbi:MAG: putative zinc-binding metallopeptidase [Candidatus Omnitrophota bacterium]